MVATRGRWGEDWPFGPADISPPHLHVVIARKYQALYGRAVNFGR